MKAVRHKEPTQPTTSRYQPLTLPTTSHYQPFTQPTTSHYQPFTQPTTSHYRPLTQPTTSRYQPFTQPTTSQCRQCCYVLMQSRSFISPVRYCTYHDDVSCTAWTIQRSRSHLCDREDIHVYATVSKSVFWSLKASHTVQ